MSNVNLAPNHKQGLPLANPLMIGAGAAGYGEALFSGIDTAALGAVGVGPILRHSSSGAPPPRVAESGSNYVLGVGVQNRGIANVLKKFRKTWSRLGCPVIPQIADTAPESCAFVAEKLTESFDAGDPIAGIELLLSPTSTPQASQRLIRTLLRTSDLPILVKLPFESAASLAEISVDAGADCLVIGQPPRAALIRMRASSHANQPLQETLIAGSLGGPALFPLLLRTLIQIKARNLNCTLVASGGIYSATQARHLIECGATAVQLDGAIWVEPGLVATVLDRL